MCRLYGMRATHPTRVECELIVEQNALIRLSVRDERGEANPDGWGIGVAADGAIQCTRQTDPASESPEFRARAVQVNADTVIAHVRRATVGGASEENTHPFCHGRSMLAHNGHIPAFDEVRPRIIKALDADRRDSLRGDTDSEHFFQLLLSQLGEPSVPAMVAALRRAITDVQTWTGETGAAPEPALNILWTFGTNLVGSRLRRSLWYVERRAPRLCRVCGASHGDPPPGEDYRSVTVASEPLTDEAWSEVPEGSLFWVEEAMHLRLEPIEKAAPTSGLAKTKESAR